MKLSTDKILAKVVHFSHELTQEGVRKHLDMGSGTGALIALIREAHPNIES